MIRIVHGSAPRRFAHLAIDTGYCMVVCEQCGAEGERRYGTSDWDTASATAAAARAGWLRRLDGRVERDFCPSCAKTRRTTGRGKR